MKFIKKSLSIFLVLVLVLSIIPMTEISLRADAALIFGLPVKDLSTKVTCDINGYSNHNGFDLGVSVGTELYSMFSGTATYYQRYVKSTGKSASYGNYVVVTSDDGKYKAYYCHMSSFNGFSLSSSINSCQNYPSSWDNSTCAEVVRGTKHVSEGELLGKSGSTGNSTGPHCHIGLKVNNSFVDPEDYISFSYSAASGGGSSSVSFNATVDTAVDGVTIDKATNPYYNVGGWAYCSDKSDTTVYWCIDDKEAYVANKNNRQDVVNAHGCRLDCGFDFSIPIKDLSVGQHKLSIWVNSSSGSADINAAYFNVTSSDTTVPVVKDVAFSNELDNFLVTCGISDDYGISRVEFAVWTAYNGQDDLKIHTGNISGDGYAWCVVNNSDHNYETGTYYVDIYVYDNSNNRTFKSTYEVYVGNMIVLHGITNADGSDAYIDINGTPTLTGERRFWFYNYNLDTHYYINVYVDDKIVLDHVQSDGGRYVSYVVDTGTLSDGKHTIKAELADSNGAFAYTKEFHVNNLIAFTGISETNNTGWIDISGTPTISGTKKIWFKKESSDTNYYIDMYVDGVKVESHKSTDASGSYSYAVDTTKLSNGKHTFRAELFDSKAYYTATKTVIVNNPQYTLTFNANGGKCSTASKIIVKNSTYGTLPTPTRDRYSFDGWYTAASGGTKITADTKVTVTGNQTLYAHWTCKHVKYNFSVTKEATCTATGVKTYVCATCSHTYTETISVKAHSYQSTVTKPTCTEKGYTTYTCSACGDTYNTDEIAATGHNYGEWTVVKEATCTEDGLKEKVCVCTAKESEAIPAKGHSFGNWVVVYDATCEFDGLKERTCFCNATETEIINMTDHSDNDSDGYCDDCDYSMDNTSDNNNSCSHLCHSKNAFIAKLIWPIVRFFIKLFGTNSVCSCGASHY